MLLQGGASEPLRLLYPDTCSQHAVTVSSLPLQHQQQGPAAALRFRYTLYTSWDETQTGVHSSINFF